MIGFVVGETLDQFELRKGFEFRKEYAFWKIHLKFYLKEIVWNMQVRVSEKSVYRKQESDLTHTVQPARSA